MQDIKISIITVVYNAESTIGTCIQSVLQQRFKNVEHIIIDGGSSDNTGGIVESYKSHLAHFISEPDKGIYDAMNKGIKLATGDVVGMLNADDFFTDDTVLSIIADAFQKNNIDITYGDLDYIDGSGRVIRKWRSGKFTRRRLTFGWMPPHPTFYCKRYVFEKYGLYSLEYGTAADYQLMLNCLYVNRLKVFYIKKVIIKMKIGGISNKSLVNRVKGLLFDLKAMKNARIALPVFTLIIKPLRKIFQYF